MSYIAVLPETLGTIVAVTSSSRFDRESFYASFSYPSPFLASSVLILTNIKTDLVIGADIRYHFPCPLPSFQKLFKYSQCEPSYTERIQHYNELSP